MDCTRTSVASCLERLLFVFFGLLFLAPPSRAAALSEAHTNVDLIAEDSGCVPGRGLWVGLRFALEKDWHIYWRNPGDSGEPPRVQWNLPTGFRSEPMQWPYPTRLGASSVVDYGYEDEVLLMLPIQAPASLKLGQRVALEASVKWLVCRDICIPGQARLTLSLPVVKDQRASPWRALFAATRKRVPRPAPSNWRVKVVSDNDEFVLTVASGARETQAAFFPLEPGQIENAVPQIVTPFREGVRVRLKKSDQLLTPLTILKGILVLHSGRAYEIATPVVHER